MPNLWLGRRLQRPEPHAEISLGAPLDFLLSELEQAQQRSPHDRQLVELTMANRFLWAALGDEIWTRKIAFGTSPDPWMLNGIESPPLTNALEKSRRRVTHYHRLIRLADAFFTLMAANTKGVEGLIKRFGQRDTQSCFAEVEIAALLVKNGFVVDIRQERGVRGEDFDLQAVYRGDVINVEVTSKFKQGPLDPRTLGNILKKKRSQVPKSAPAALYIQVPSHWMGGGSSSVRTLDQAIVPFIRRSGRFNAIVFVWEYVAPASTGGLPHQFMRPCFSEVARHAFNHRELLTCTPDETGKVRMARSFLDALEGHQRKDASHPDSP